MRVLRVYHSGRDPAHRLRERALLRAGVEVSLLVPQAWPDAGSQVSLSEEPFPVLELPVRRPGDVNRHRYDPRDLRRVLEQVKPDLLDLHEEPFSTVVHQWLQAAGDLPVVGYTAQNIDKRWPPPFHGYEKAAFERLSALYPCSRQAASVARGKGFAGQVEVLPLGVDDRTHYPGDQRHDDPVWTLLLVGRLVPEKGVVEAVEVLERVRRHHPTRLVVVGEGPEGAAAHRRAQQLGMGESVELKPWLDAAGLAEQYRRAHVVLLPSRATRTWVEQFGRVITEGQAAGCVVVGWASGSIPEVGSGWMALSPERDVAGMAAHIDRLRELPRAYERLRRGGLARAAEVSWSGVAHRQAALYDSVLTGGARPTAVTGRSAAAAEFGPPAAVAGGGRPFALPVLREDNVATRALARLVDVTASWAPDRRGRTR